MLQRARSVHNRGSVRQSAPQTVETQITLPKKPSLRFKIKRPPNAFLIFAKARRTAIAKEFAEISHSNAKLVATMKKFAERTHAPLSIIKHNHMRAKKLLKSKKCEAATVAADVWLESLALVPDGDLSKVVSIPNNTISKFVSREWVWLNLVNPAEAEQYFTMQQAEKEAHEVTNPGYIYKPAKRTMATQKQKCNKKPKTPKSRKPPQTTAATEATAPTRAQQVPSSPVSAPLRPSVHIFTEAAIRAGSAAPSKDRSPGFKDGSLLDTLDDDIVLRDLDVLHSYPDVDAVFAEGDFEGHTGRGGESTATLWDALDDGIVFARKGGDVGRGGEAAATPLQPPAVVPMFGYENGPVEIGGMVVY